MENQRSFGKGILTEPIGLGCRLSYNRTWRVISIHSRSTHLADCENFTSYLVLVKNSFAQSRIFLRRFCPSELSEAQGYIFGKRRVGKPSLTPGVV